MATAGIAAHRLRRRLLSRFAKEHSHRCDQATIEVNVHFILGLVLEKGPVNNNDYNVKGIIARD